MSCFDSRLREGERILFYTRKSWAMIIPFLSSVFVSIAAFAIPYLVDRLRMASGEPQPADKQDIVTPVMMVFFFISVMYALVSLFRLVSLIGKSADVRCAVTDKRVLVRKGLLFHSFKDFWLPVNSLMVEQDTFGRRLGYGTVSLSDETGTIVSCPCLKGAVELEKLILKYMEDNGYGSRAECLKMFRENHLTADVFSRKTLRNVNVTNISPSEKVLYDGSPRSEDMTCLIRVSFIMFLINVSLFILGVELGWNHWLIILTGIITVVVIVKAIVDVIHYLRLKMSGITCVLTNFRVIQIRSAIDVNFIRLETISEVSLHGFSVTIRSGGRDYICEDVYRPQDFRAAVEKAVVEARNRAHVV